MIAVGYCGSGAAAELCDSTQSRREVVCSSSSCARKEEMDAGGVGDESCARRARGGQRGEAGTKNTS